LRGGRGLAGGLLLAIPGDLFGRMKRLDGTTTTRSGMRSSSPAHQRASNCAEIPPSAAPTAARPLSGHNAAAKVAIPSMKARRRVAYPKLMAASTYDGVITSRDLRAAEWGSGVSLPGINPEPPMSALPPKAEIGFSAPLPGHRPRPHSGVDDGRHPAV